MTSRTVTMTKPNDSTPWGFRISSFTGIPIIAKVRPGTIASHFVQEGEPLLKIGKTALTGRSMDDIMEILQSARNFLVLTLDTEIVDLPNKKFLTRSQTQPESSVKGPPNEVTGPRDFSQSELVRLIQEEERGYNKGPDLQRGGYGPDGDPIPVQQRNISNVGSHKVKQFKEPRWRTTDAEHQISKNQKELAQEFQNLRMHRSQEWEPSHPVDYEEDGDPERRACFKGDTIPSKAFRVLQTMVQHGDTRHGGQQGGRRQRAIYKWTPVDHEPSVSRSANYVLKKTGSLYSNQGYRSPQTARGQIYRTNTNVPSQFGEVTDSYTDF